MGDGIRPEDGGARRSASHSRRAGAASYAFSSRWELPAPPDHVWVEIERMLRPDADGWWWPGVAVPEPPPRLAAGERMTLAVRSPLGYRLRMGIRLTEVVPGACIAAESTGDLSGTGRVLVEPASAGTVVVVDWNVETRRRWMNVTAAVLRPVFERAHAAVMRAGERGMRQALERDAAASEPRNAGNPGESTGDDPPRR
jgi:hypothetical protein